MRRRLLLQATTACCLGAGCSRALAEAPPRHTTQDIDWRDEGRGRAVPVRLYLPAAADTGPAPLLVFSHGIGGSRAGYGYLGRHLASQGVAALHLQHVGSDRGLWMGNVLTLIQRLQTAAHESEALDRVHDLRFALDRLLEGEFAPRIDATRIVAAGHSYGANTALLAAGAQVQREGRTLDLREPRLRAAMLISAPPFYGEPSPEAVLAPLKLPSLHITAADDVIRIPGYYSGVADRLKVFEAAGSRPKWLALFNRGTHSGFVGRAGDAAPLVVATKELALAFVQQVLDGDAQALPGWQQRHAGMVERFVSA
jgi:dienelactone hydrolase